MFDPDDNGTTAASSSEAGNLPHEMGQIEAGFFFFFFARARSPGSWLLIG